MFPEELPKRLIKMFTFVGDTVLDPFLGSGTTIKATLNLNRNSVGYEINEKFLPIIKKKIGYNTLLTLTKKVQVEIIKRKEPIKIEKIEYTPNIKDTKPLISPKKFNFEGQRLYKVKKILSPEKLELDTA